MYIPVLFYYIENIRDLFVEGAMVVHVNHEDIKRLIVSFNDFCLTVHLNLTLPSPCELTSLVFCLTWLKFVFKAAIAFVCQWRRTRTMYSNNAVRWYTEYLFKTVRNSSTLYPPHIEDNCFHRLS